MMMPLTGKAICRPLEAECPGCAIPVRPEIAEAIDRDLARNEHCHRCGRDRASLARDRAMGLTAHAAAR